MPGLRERRYRGALIGVGGVALQSHLPAFHLPLASARLDIVAAVDPSPKPEIAGLPIYADLAPLEDLDLDFVDICTPTSSHLELTLWALQRGLHVLCEKPVALTPEEAARIRCAALTANRIVMPCHQYRFNPAWRRIREWLEREAIGRWYLAEFDVYRLAADLGTGTDGFPWRGRAASARGGVLLDHGTHLLYQLLDVAGQPTQVRAWAGRLRHATYDVEDTAHVLLEFPGRMAKLFLTWAGRTRENRIRFIGEAGTIEWSAGLLTLERSRHTTSFDHTAELRKESYATWFAELFATFAGAMDTGDLEPLNDIAKVADLLGMAYSSLHGGAGLAVMA